MSGPLLLAGLTAAALALLTLLHDRRRASAAVAATAMGLAGIFALLAPIDQAVEVMGMGLKLDPEFELLGRRLLLDASNRAAVGFLYAGAGLLFAGGWLTRRGRYFYSAGSLLIGALAGALMVQPFLFAAIFLELAALAAVLMLASPGRPARVGAQRLLVFYTLSLATVLVTGWLLETTGVSAGATEEAARIKLLLGLGFAVLLFVPPFHLWIPRAAERADVYSLVFVMVALHSSGYFFLLQFLDAYEWLRLAPDVAFAMRAGGAAMALMGGAWALAQSNLVRTGAFILLVDLGVSLLVAGRASADAYALGLGLAGARVVGAGLWGLALALLERSSGGVERDDLTGAGYSNPLPAAAMAVGLLSLAGAPLTAGFPGRWAAIGVFGKAYVLSATTVVVCVMLCSAAVLRWVGVLLKEPERSPPSAPKSGWERGYLLAGMGCSLLLGLLPQILYPWVFQVVSGLSNLVPGG